ncbi:hypothetical protein Ctob_007179 [Chrysochromulina tobinii]|uniref:Histidine kinase/HSP90-like ATPase domain-containing protein n=1 Tax=Chrysochromulina tobinii TaxID=1460289 RepID=A0A0M0K3V5_9EUKA|nr:hypothetical protein Ctob_007179 [Chrysochromulina tobinii]|eukprot:KOO33546.1 hypothetical protein Ctob_007179 [Chrysochromulina sp. CCMP291]
MTSLLKRHDAHLKMIAEQLETVIDWVHRRQVFVQLEANTYATMLWECDLGHELSKIFHHLDSELILSCSQRVLVDKNVLNIVIEETASNAFKYREPHTKIRVNISIETATEATIEAAAVTAAEAFAHGEKPSTGCLGFIPQGAVPGDQFLHIAICNQNRAGVAPLTPTQCRRIFEPGFKVHCASALSDGVGLDSVTKACAAAGGRAWMSSLSTEPDSSGYTSFHALLPANDESPTPFSSTCGSTCDSPSDSKKGALHRRASSHMQVLTTAPTLPFPNPHRERRPQRAPTVTARPKECPRRRSETAPPKLRQRKPCSRRRFSLVQTTSVWTRPLRRCLHSCVSPSMTTRSSGLRTPSSLSMRWARTVRARGRWARVRRSSMRLWMSLWDDVT